MISTFALKGEIAIGLALPPSTTRKSDKIYETTVLRHWTMIPEKKKTNKEPCDHFGFHTEAAPDDCTGKKIPSKQGGLAELRKESSE